jgi:L-lactate dehydrogenase
VAAAYAAFARRTASEILLVDRDRARAEGEAMDLMHGQALIGRVVVRAAAWEELGHADVVLIAAGANQKRGESRLDLAARNAAVMRDVVRELDRHAPDAVVIVSTNPVDVLTQLVVKESKRPERHVLGTGTTLDSARFRALLGEHFGASPRSVHAYVLGEHGDSEVPIWSNASVGGVPIASSTILGRPLDAAARKSIAARTRDAAAHIIERKGYTNLAIGLVMAQLADVVLSDQRSVHTTSVVLHGEYGIDGVALALPCVLGRDGILGRIVPELADDELAAVRRSAEILREGARRVGLA